MSNEDTVQSLLIECGNRIIYQYGKTDGTISFPNTFDGDILKLVYRASKLSVHQERKDDG